MLLIYTDLDSITTGFILSIPSSRRE